MGFLVLIKNDLRTIRWVLPGDDISFDDSFGELISAWGKKSPPGYRKARYVVVDFPDYNPDRMEISDYAAIPVNPPWVTQNLDLIYRIAREEFMKIANVGLHNRKVLKLDPNCLVGAREHYYSPFNAPYELNDLNRQLYSSGDHTAVVSSSFKLGEIFTYGDFDNSPGRSIKATPAHMESQGKTISIRQNGYIETLIEPTAHLMWPVVWLSRVNIARALPETDPMFL